MPGQLVHRARQTRLLEALLLICMLTTTTRASASRTFSSFVELDGDDCCSGDVDETDADYCEE